MTLSEIMSSVTSTSPCRIDATEPTPAETSRHPIEVIARETGFGDRERMRQSLLRAFGMPPQAVQRVSANAELV